MDFGFCDMQVVAAEPNRPGLPVPAKWLRTAAVSISGVRTRRSPQSRV
jgi:hypothetical protein